MSKKIKKKKKLRLPKTKKEAEEYFKRRYMSMLPDGRMYIHFKGKKYRAKMLCISEQDVAALKLLMPKKLVIHTEVALYRMKGARPKISKKWYKEDDKNE